MIIWIISSINIKLTYKWLHWILKKILTVVQFLLVWLIHFTIRFTSDTHTSWSFCWSHSTLVPTGFDVGTNYKGICSNPNGPGSHLRCFGKVDINESLCPVQIWNSFWNTIETNPIPWRDGICQWVPVRILMSQVSWDHSVSFGFWFIRGTCYDPSWSL